MIAALDTALAAERRRVETRLRGLLSREAGVPSRLRRAMAHSLFGGGKRLRPILLLWAYDAVRREAARSAAPPSAALDTACALEMIHTYSLIHDDLPAMDDDVLRRGRPTCHVVFGEATAILAGDGLQALAFEILAGLGPAVLPAARVIATASGPAGMVGGQEEDLAAADLPPSASMVRRIHRLKTAALIAAALAAGGVLGGASSRRAAALSAAGEALGLAFQEADDLLDAGGGGPAVAGAGAGDAATWLRLLGAEGARRRLERDGRRGQRALAAALPAGERAERLLALGHRLWNRDR